MGSMWVLWACVRGAGAGAGRWAAAEILCGWQTIRACVGEAAWLRALGDPERRVERLGAWAVAGRVMDS